MMQSKRVADVRASHLVLLMAILIGGAMLRLHQLGKNSFWFDEICSVFSARGQSQLIFEPPAGYFEHAPAVASSGGQKPWRDVWSGFDATPPLYPAVFRIWMDVFGDRDVTARLLSVTLSLATVVALFDLCRLITSPAAALWACALCAASPPQVHYAREARSYAMVCFISVLLLDVALRLSLDARKPRPAAIRFLLLGILCVLAFYTHFFLAGAIVGTSLYTAIKLRGRARLMMIAVIAIAFAASLFEVPVILSHPRQLKLGIDWLAEPREGLALHTLLRACALPAFFLVQPIDLETILATPSILLVVVALFLDKSRPGLRLMGIWSLCIIGTVAASDLWLGHGGLGYVRYTLAASPAVFVCFVALADLGGRWTRHLLPALAVAGGLLAVPQVYFDEYWQKTESRALAQDLRDRMTPGDFLVVLSRPKMGLYSAGNEYAAIDFYIGPIPGGAAIFDGPANDAIQRSIWSHHRVWVVECYYGADVVGYLGPCKLTPAGTTRYHAGRLYFAEPLTR